MKHKLSSAFRDLLNRHPDSDFHSAFVGHSVSHPVFCLSESPLPVLRDDYEALFQLAADEFEAGELPFPYPQFNIECPCSPGGSGKLLVNVFQLDISGVDCWALRIALASDDEVEVCPYSFTYIKGTLPLVTWCGSSGQVEPTLSDEDRDFASGTVVIVLNLLMLLRMSYASVEKVNIDAENRRRKRSNRSPLPEQHIVTIDTNKLAGVQRVARGNHASPTGHLRRDHLRRLANGKIIEVRNALIKGGPAGQVSYAVH